MWASYGIYAARPMASGEQRMFHEWFHPIRRSWASALLPGCPERLPVAGNSRPGSFTSMT